MLPGAEMFPGAETFPGAEMFPEAETFPETGMIPGKGAPGKETALESCEPPGREEALRGDRKSVV